jgi:hypothetical protein
LILKKKLLSLNVFQFFTFDDTSSSEFKSTSTINIFVTIEISKRNVLMKNKKMILFFRKIKSLNKENNFFFRKNSFLYFHASNLSNNFFEIKNAFLNVLISRNINFCIDEINIIKKKNSKIFKRFCEHDLNKRKNTKNLRILYNNDDCFQHENVKIHNKDDIVVLISY